MSNTSGAEDDPVRWYWEGRLQDARATIESLTSHVTDLQTRCTELLEESRAHRLIAKAPATELRALSHLSHERRLQDVKWGPLTRMLDIPNGTGVLESQTTDREVARSVCEDAFHYGQGSWADVLREEVAEALAESDPKLLREELVQVGAVAVKWIEILDLREARGVKVWPGAQPENETAVDGP